MNERFPHDRYDRPRGKPPFLRDEPPAALERNKGDDSSTAESFPERTIFNGQKLPPADVLRERARRGEWDVDIWRQQLLDAGFVRSDQDIRRDAHAQMTRRTFLRGAAATAAVGIAGATGLAGMTAIGQLKMEQLARFLDDASGEPQYDYDTAISEAKTFLKTAYDIDLKVGVGKDHENIVGDHASMERTRDTLRHLVQELKRYPPDMIQKLGEGRGFQIHIVESRLIVKDKAPTGEIVMERSVAGVAPFLKEGRPATMILKSDGEDEWQRTLIHHELNHRFAEKWQVWRERDEKWIAMHAPMTERPYWGYYKVNDRKDKTPTPAYVFRRYGLAAPVEDQAICAEAALIPRLHAYMEDAIRTTADPHAKKVLRAKLQATKADYLVWSGGKMDAKYWERLCKEHKDDYVADVSPDEYTDASFGDEWREHVPLPRPRPRIGKSRRK